MSLCEREQGESAWEWREGWVGETMRCWLFVDSECINVAFERLIDGGL